MWKEGRDAEQLIQPNSPPKGATRTFQCHFKSQIKPYGGVNTDVAHISWSALLLMHCPAAAISTQYGALNSYTSQPAVPARLEGENDEHCCSSTLSLLQAKLNTKSCPRRGAQSLVERGKCQRAGWEMKNFNQGPKEPSAEGCWPPRLAWSNNGCECPAFQINLTSCPQKKHFSCP